MCKVTTFSVSHKTFHAFCEKYYEKLKKMGMCRKIVRLINQVHILAYVAVDQSGAVGESEGDYAYAGCGGCIMDSLGGCVKCGDYVIDKKDVFVL